MHNPQMQNIHKQKQKGDTTSNMSNNCNRKRSRDNNSPDVQLSKSLSWVLRHAASSLGLKLSSDGYIPLHNILILNHPRFCKGGKDSQPKYTVEDVVRVVENNDKQRFRLEYKEKVLCIRANQGHSLKVKAEELLTSLTYEELSHPNLSIIHGTTLKAWGDHIQHKGLSRMKRNHIHFATGLPQPPESSTSNATKSIQNKQENEHKQNTRPISGMRSTSQIYIYINGSKCGNDGIKFYKSDNGVILTAGINEEGMLPLAYFDKVVDAATGNIIN